jgi:flagellar basal-body rod protein FlgG
MRALWISGSGLAAEEQKIDLVANNISNVNTTGYKFQDAFAEEMAQINDSGDTSAATPAGVSVADTGRNFSQGDLTASSGSLDVAIQGSGFMEVTMPDDSIGYTRSGALGVDANGTIVTKNGYKLYPEITIPDDSTAVSISTSGQVSSTMSDGSVKVLGSIELAKFVNPGGLKSAGDGIYQSTVNSGEPVIDSPGKQGLGTIQQGYLEGSNVSLVNEMSKMMITQRSYEMNAKVVQTTDQMMSIANGIKR